MRLEGMDTAHYRRTGDGSLERHDGPLERCAAAECAWPQIGTMVTVISSGRRVTGDLIGKSGNVVKVRTADGKEHPAARVTVTRPEWGVYCPHGTKLIEAEEAEHTCELSQPSCELSGSLGHLCIDHRNWCKACYPDGRKIQPWPCEEDGCSEADFDREQQEMEEQYWEEMRREAYGL